MNNYEENVPQPDSGMLTQVESLLEQSRTAKDNGDFKRALYFDHWALQTLIFRLKNYARAHDLAVQAALDCRKPVHQDQMERICVHEDLIFTYIGIDPLGYAELIENALQYMEKEIKRPTQCYYCLLEARSAFELSCGNLERATAAVQTYISEAQGDQYHHFGIAHAKVCELMYLHRNWEKLFYFGRMGEQVLGNSPDKTEYVAVVLAGQALALRRLGREQDALIAYRKSVTRASKVQGAMQNAYYNFLCAFHTASGELQSAIELRKRQLGDMTGTGQPFWEARARLQLLQLIKQQGKPFQDELEPIRQLASKLRKPDIIIGELDKILAK